MSASNLDLNVNGSCICTSSRWELFGEGGVLKLVLSWASWDAAIRWVTRADSQIFRSPSVRKRFHLGV